MSVLQKAELAPGLSASDRVPCPGPLLQLLHGWNGIQESDPGVGLCSGSSWPLLSRFHQKQMDCCPQNIRMQNGTCCLWGWGWRWGGVGWSTALSWLRVPEGRHGQNSHCKDGKTKAKGRAAMSPGAHGDFASPTSPKLHFHKPRSLLVPLSRVASSTSAMPLTATRGAYRGLALPS